MQWENEQLSIMINHRVFDWWWTVHFRRQHRTLNVRHWIQLAAAAVVVPDHVLYHRPLNFTRLFRDVDGGRVMLLPSVVPCCCCCCCCSSAASHYSLVGNAFSLLLSVFEMLWYSTLLYTAFVVQPSARFPSFLSLYYSSPKIERLGNVFAFAVSCGCCCSVSTESRPNIVRFLLRLNAFE